MVEEYRHTNDRVKTEVGRVVSDGISDLKETTVQGSERYTLRDLISPRENVHPNARLHGTRDRSDVFSSTKSECPMDVSYDEGCGDMPPRTVLTVNSQTGSHQPDI